MGKKGDFDCRYNAQISVDEDHQIIVGQHLTQYANDKMEVKPATLDNVQEMTGTLPDKLSADNGYLSGDNLEDLEESGVDAYMATDKGEKKNKISLEDCDRRLSKADFDYKVNSGLTNQPFQGGNILKNIVMLIFMANSGIII